MVLGSNPAVATSLGYFGNSVYPALPLPVSFGGDNKSRRSLLSHSTEMTQQTYNFEPFKKINHYYWDRRITDG